METAPQHPKPPKKPLTPYMRFSKSIWQEVKGVNPSMSVCEIGASIGKMWRELTDEQKQKYNEDFVKEKAKYDEELQAYLKMTGLQASDLVKSKSRKKDSNKQSNLSNAAAPIVPMGNPAHAAMGMHRMAPPGYPGQNQMMAPPGFPAPNSSAASSLPHFSQIWASSPYDQNMQMNLMAMANQAGQHGMQNGAAAMMFQQLQQAQQQQHQMQQQQQQAQQQQAAGQQEQGHVQQQVQAQQQQGQPTSEQMNHMSPMYNGSPQVPSPHVNQASPMSGTTQNPNVSQAETLPNTGQQQAGFEQQMRDSNSASHGQQSPASVQWQWQNQQAPNGQFLQGQNASQASHQSNNGLVHQQNASFESQPEQAQQQQRGSRPPSATPQTPPVTQDSTTKQEESKEANADPSGHSPQSHQQSPAQPASSENSNSGVPAVSATTSAPVSTTNPAFPQYPSAHSLFNSYANFNMTPWGQPINESKQTATTGNGNEQQQQLFRKQNIVETELLHLRSALTEKTKEVQRLSQELEKACQIIEHLKQEKASGGGGGGNEAN